MSGPHIGPLTECSVLSRCLRRVWKLERRGTVPAVPSHGRTVEAVKGRRSPFPALSSSIVSDDRALSYLFWMDPGRVCRLSVVRRPGLRSGNGSLGTDAGTRLGPSSVVRLHVAFHRTRVREGRNHHGEQHSLEVAHSRRRTAAPQARLQFSVLPWMPESQTRRQREP